MIRVYVTTDKIERDGGFSLTVYGHAGTMVCAGVSSALNGLVLNLRAIAARYPKECRFYGKTHARPKRGKKGR